MSYIPDCRTDENYNEKYLNDKNKMFLAGYDWAVAEIKNMFSNLSVYPDVEMLLDDDIAMVKEGKAQAVEEAVDDWAEMSRNELITSMIDGMEEAEYEAIKAKVDAEG